MKDEGRLPRLSPTLGPPVPDELRVAARRGRPHVCRTTSRGASPSRRASSPSRTRMSSRCRYGKGSNSMGLLTSVLTVPRPGQKRWRTWMGEMARQPRDVARLLYVRKWSERAIISLVMQTVDNSLTLTGRRSRSGRWHLTTKPGRVEARAHLPARRPGRRSAARREDRRHPVRQCLRERRCGAHGALRRRVHDRRRRDEGRHRRLPPRVRAPGAAHRRRVRHHREPRREPVADDHRAGRAGHGDVAEQGRA